MQSSDKTILELNKELNKKFDELEKYLSFIGDVVDALKEIKESVNPFEVTK